MSNECTLIWPDRACWLWWVFMTALPWAGLSAWKCRGRVEEDLDSFSLSPAHILTHQHNHAVAILENVAEIEKSKAVISPKTGKYSKPLGGGADWPVDWILRTLGYKWWDRCSPAFREQGLAVTDKDNLPTSDAQKWFCYHKVSLAEQGYKTHFSLSLSVCPSPHLVLRFWALTSLPVQLILCSAVAEVQKSRFGSIWDARLLHRTVVEMEDRGRYLSDD